MSSKKQINNSSILFMASWLLHLSSSFASETRPIVGDIIHALEFIQEYAVATQLNPKPETHCVLQM
jgi:hypothetical protein